MQQLFELVQRCVHEGHAEPIITPSQQIAADRFVAGIDLAEVQAAFAALEDVLWRHLAGTVSAGQRLETLRLVNVILGTGRDALARTYVSLAGRTRRDGCRGPTGRHGHAGHRGLTGRLGRVGARLATPATQAPRRAWRDGPDQFRGGCRGPHGRPRPGRRHHPG